MAGNVYLYTPSGENGEKTGSEIAACIPVYNTENYTDIKKAATDAVSRALRGEISVIAADEGQFFEAKAGIIKGLGSRVLRSAKLTAALGDRFPEKSREYNLHTAIPEGAEAFPSADGMYSPISCRAGKGIIILLPGSAQRLSQALETGIFKTAKAKNAKEKLAVSLGKIAASGKKTAVADFGKGAALLAVAENYPEASGVFETVTALTDEKYGTKSFEACLAKSAKETAEADFGAVISEISEEGVTICVSDSETARVETIKGEAGESAKQILASAVIRECEMLEEAVAEGAVIAPGEKVAGISKRSFIIILSCLLVTVLACLAIAIALFGKETGKKETDPAADALEASSVQEVEAPGEVELILDNETTLTELLSETETSSIDTFDNYTTYIGSGASGPGAAAIFTTIAQLFDDEEEESTAGETAEGEETSATEPAGRFIFTVYGWGHGAGMSQDGAKALARSGKSCNQILTYYYPNTVIMTDPNTPMYTEQPDAEGKGGYTLLAFLCRTVKQEIGDNAPYEALKAQAVAAYTYAMYHGNFGAGQTMDYDYAYEGTNVERAVMDVMNITSAEQQPHCNYVSYNGRYANAVYFSNCAGTITSSVNAWGGRSIPYLCGGMSSPEEVDITTYEISAAEMRNRIMSYAGSSAQLGRNPATWLRIISHDGAYNEAIGYIYTISAGGVEMSGNTFRSKVMGGNLRSHCFTIEYVK